jgi:hypothetical protein
MFSFQSYPAYIESVAQQSQRIVTLTQPLSHYITLYGFFREILPHTWAVSGTILAALPLIYWLWMVWRKAVAPPSSDTDLQWAMMLTTTLLLMHHGFVYDLILLTLDSLPL